MRRVLRALSSRLTSPLSFSRQFSNVNTEWNLEGLTEIPDFSLTGTVYTHPDHPSTELLHFAPIDETVASARPTSVGVFFRTLPFDSSGTFHVLEHVVLSSPSVTYQLRNTFFQFLSRSLFSYANAWTFQDWTAYVFSSPNQRDLGNLCDVYGDCLWGSSVDPSICLQESSVVSNEMRGVLMDPESSFYYGSRMMAYGSRTQGDLSAATGEGVGLTPYAHNSGGNPFCWDMLQGSSGGSGPESLLQTYHECYAPSQTRILVYGRSADAQVVIERLSDRMALWDHSNIDTIRTTPRNTFASEYELFEQEQNLTSAHHSHIDQISGPEDLTCPGSKISLTWLFDRRDDVTTRSIYQEMCFAVLSALLFDVPRGLLYRRLIGGGNGVGVGGRSPLALRFGYGCGFDVGTLWPSFTIALSGVKNPSEEATNVQNQILDVLYEFASSENDESDVLFLESILRHVELSAKAIRQPDFGLASSIGFQELMTDWNHTDVPPVDRFQIVDFCRHLREDGGIRHLQKLVRDVLLNDNALRNVKSVWLDEDPEYTTRLRLAEEEMLADTSSNFLEMDARLPEEEDVDESSGVRLPSVSIETDIQRGLDLIDLDYPLLLARGPETHFGDNAAGGVSTFLSPETNGCFHCSVVKPIPNIIEDPTLLSLFSRFWSNVGTSHLTPEELATQETLCCGGISASLQIVPSPHRTNLYQPMFVMSSYCLNENVGAMLELMANVWHDPAFVGNEEYVGTQMEQMGPAMWSHVVSNGDAVAVGAAEAALTQKGAFRSSISGIDFVRSVDGILEGEDSWEEELCRDLSDVHLALFQGGNATTSGASVLFTGDDKELLRDAAIWVDTSNPFGEELVDLPLSFTWWGRDADTNFSEDSARSLVETIDLPLDNAGISFVGRALSTDVVITNERWPSLWVLSKLLKSEILHPKIREEGGAYGARCTAKNGLLTFGSYRDPTPIETIQVFDDLMSEKEMIQSFSPEKIAEAKIECFRSLDSPRTAHGLAYREFASVRSFEERLLERERLLHVSESDVLELCEEILFDETTPTATVILGNPSEE